MSSACAVTQPAAHDMLVSVNWVKGAHVTVPPPPPPPESVLLVEPPSVPLLWKQAAPDVQSPAPSTQLRWESEIDAHCASQLDSESIEHTDER